MDAITLLKNDHRQVQKLFRRYEQAGPRATKQKRELVDRMSEELARHAAIEEQWFYPVVRASVDGAESTTLESLEEHHIVKWLLSELDGMDPSDERFDAKVTVLIENVRHHVAEEEDDLFPMVRDQLSRSELAELGEHLEQAKATAPTHPHPKASDTPPGNRVTGLISGVVDRVEDTISGVLQGSTAGVQDLVAKITDRRSATVAPHGTSHARSTAKKTRARADDAEHRVENTTRTASRGASSTAKAARSGAKATATTARRSAKSTATTAKRAATTTKRTAGKAATRTRQAARSRS